MIPKDPVMLLSFINLKLRDCYSNLDELCEDLEVDKDELIGKLEDGNVPISEAFKLYKDGIKLVENCNQQLDKVEKEIIVLNKSEVGSDEF